MMPTCSVRAGARLGATTALGASVMGTSSIGRRRLLQQSEVAHGVFEVGVGLGTCRGKAGIMRLKGHGLGLNRNERCLEALRQLRVEPVAHLDWVERHRLGCPYNAA